MPACSVEPPPTPSHTFCFCNRPCVWSRQPFCPFAALGASFFPLLFFFVFFFFSVTCEWKHQWPCFWPGGRQRLTSQRRLTPKHWHSLPVFTRVCRRAHNAAGAVCKVHKRVVPTAGGQKAARLSLRVYTAHEKVFEQGILECKLPQPFYYPARRLSCGWKNCSGSGRGLLCVQKDFQTHYGMTDPMAQMTLNPFDEWLI